MKSKSWMLSKRGFMKQSETGQVFRSKLAFVDLFLESDRLTRQETSGESAPFWLPRRAVWMKRCPWWPFRRKHLTDSVTISIENISLLWPNLSFINATRVQFTDWTTKAQRNETKIPVSCFLFLLCVCRLFLFNPPSGMNFQKLHNDGCVTMGFVSEWSRVFRAGRRSLAILPPTTVASFIRPTISHQRLLRSAYLIILSAAL